MAFDLGAGARRHADRSGGADLGGNAPGDPFDPVRVDHVGDHDVVLADVGEGEGPGRQARQREAGHLQFRISPAHAVGVDRRIAGECGDHHRLQAVAAADLHAHHGIEAAAEMGFHCAHRPERMVAVRQPFLRHQRRAHGRDDRHQRVVGQGLGFDQAHRTALAAEQLDVPQLVIGIAAATGAEDPGTQRQGVHLRFAEQAGLRHHGAGRRPQGGETSFGRNTVRRP